MNTMTSQVHQQAEELLELSNSMLAAAIAGQWAELEFLDRQRAEVFAKLLATEVIDEPDRIFLIGAMEHIRVVDRSTREFIGWQQAAGSGETLEDLNPGSLGGESAWPELADNGWNPGDSSGAFSQARSNIHSNTILLPK